MSNDIIKVEVSSNDTAKDLVELAKITYSLRYYSKIWHESYGNENRKRMELWQDKIDKWLEFHVHHVRLKR